MPLSMKLLSGIGQKLKARYFFPGLAGLIAVAAVLVANQQDEVRIGTADYEAVEEDSSQQEIDPQDAWMYKIVEPNSDIDPQNIYSFACEIRTKRPETLTTVCADFGSALWEIKWGKWDAFGGRGEGIYRENDCEPSCAEGTISSRPATVLLNDLTFDGTRYFFNTAKIRFKDVDYAKDEYEFIWDIASFYREVPDMRSENIYED
jgi:hypothetical protein